MKNNLKKILFCAILFFNFSNKAMVSESLDPGKVVNACYIKCVCFMAQHQKRSIVLLSAAFFMYVTYRCYKNLFFKQDPTLDKQKPVVKEEQAPTVESQTFVPQESVSAVQKEKPPVSSQTPIIEEQVLAKPETEPALKESETAVKKYTGLTVCLPSWDENIKSKSPCSLTDQTPLPKRSRSTIDTTRPGIFSRWRRW